ncbi:MAG: hypothetical protein LUF90_05385 [Rikenellaceae bacterium]|nr:hypothetical protein [Rikenellaceae bacterium]
MKILIAAATEKELVPFVSGYISGVQDTMLYGHRITLEYTGIGIACSVLRIYESVLKHKPDIVIQAGIAGAYPDSGLKVGDTVFVKSEVFADLGVMHGNGLKREFRECGRLLNPDEYHGKNVSGNTVATACSSYHIIENADVESMEGYGLFLVCLRNNVKFAEVRTISNIVSEDRSSWNFDLAVKNLSYELSAFIKNI